MNALFSSWHPIYSREIIGYTNKMLFCCLYEGLGGFSPC